VVINRITQLRMVNHIISSYNVSIRNRKRWIQEEPPIPCMRLAEMKIFKVAKNRCKSMIMFYIKKCRITDTARLSLYLGNITIVCYCYRIHPLSYHQMNFFDVFTRFTARAYCDYYYYYFRYSYSLQTLVYGCC
jgi:hypothetical protein